MRHVGPVPIANLRTNPTSGDGNARKFMGSAERSAATISWNQLLGRNLEWCNDGRLVCVEVRKRPLRSRVNARQHQPPVEEIRVSE